MNNKQILWEKWVNPFEPLDKDPEFLDDISIEDFSEYAEWEDYEQQKEINEKNKEEDVSKMNTKAIITPMGVIPFNEGTACTKTFKFWIGHTNFSISSKIQHIIEKTEGVETLDIFTRYRFRIGIGKAFQDRSVMENIQNKVYEK
jgi:hypothetical protein|tara:strand:- start:10402 stop:10836 length:435 start_codon:yes stop_codon:yes gene_type:complete